MKKGYSLIEILVMVAIVAILAVAVIVMISPKYSRSMPSQTIISGK